VKAGIGQRITFCNHQWPHNARGHKPAARFGFKSIETDHKQFLTDVEISALIRCDFQGTEGI